jgi:N-acetylneuraminic acid mutarotase
MFMLMVMVSLSFSGCGGGSVGSGITPTPTPIPSTVNEWTWTGGSNIVNQKGTYGTQGKAAPSNIPGAREQPVSWIDAAGNLWFFGGAGYDSVGAFNYLNDLWKYSAGQWTWMGGSNVINQTGTYGTQGTAASTNVPGARGSAVSWTDKAGNLWLFGGAGYDSVGSRGYLNDLWEYGTGEWTWMGGSNIANQTGTYGTQGTAASTNVPGARVSGASWTDAAGNVWLFGGQGYDSAGMNDLNDLWKYSAGEWTWMGGSNNLIDEAGTYGTQGTFAPSNIPGARQWVASWTDGAGNLWLFGGTGYDSVGSLGSLNDLWKYNP